MANYPKKLMDPTEAALSAIQEALNVRDDEERQAAPPEESQIPPSASADAIPHTEPAMAAFDEAIDLDDIDTRDHRTAALGPGHSPAAAMIGLGAAALLPIIFFFGIAHMAWRSQELRLITQSMAQVAMRLAEPESVARDSIVTVGQAIRREVAAMGDGVERALARAGELETLVQNE